MLMSLQQSVQPLQPRPSTIAGAEEEGPAGGWVSPVTVKSPPGQFLPAQAV
jgi:hypothetical protein